METGFGSQTSSHSTIRYNYYYCFFFILQVQLVLKLYSALCKEYSLCSENMGLWHIPALLKIQMGSKKVKITVKNFICTNWL